MSEDPQELGAGTGLQIADVVVEVNGRKTQAAPQFERGVQRLRAGGAIGRARLGVGALAGIFKRAASASVSAAKFASIRSSIAW